jgi:hypothetical protein
MTKSLTFSVVNIARRSLAVSLRFALLKIRCSVTGKTVTGCVVARLASMTLTKLSGTKGATVSSLVRSAVRRRWLDKFWESDRLLSVVRVGVNESFGSMILPDSYNDTTGSLGDCQKPRWWSRELLTVHPF